MTEEMLGRSCATATAMGPRNVEFRQGVIGDLPVEQGGLGKAFTLVFGLPDAKSTPSNR
jgi:hypothetical protein